ncbi:HAD hydrolase-like protein [Mollicutes bacterium LVI A0078]|nr:HAD hydrolase-like protein [Mollicutes bacterium LVI A0075]WOO91053.1 HAD hydrolase-like protein [Mollicutes bacterium LVI A0078]
MQLNLIWDLDGTLIDTYKLIESSLIETLDHFNINFNLNELQDYIKDTSVSTYLKEQEKLNNLEPLIMKNHFSKNLQDKNDIIELMSDAKYVLDTLNDLNISNYLFTNKGANTHNALANLELDSSFIEVITSRDGFLKKPAPHAIEYLVEKYNLD